MDAIDMLVTTAMEAPALLGAALLVGWVLGPVLVLWALVAVAERWSDLKAVTAGSAEDQEIISWSDMMRETGHGLY